MARKSLIPFNDVIKINMNYLNLEGKKFNRLLVVSVADIKHGYIRYNCKCDCGKLNIVTGKRLFKNITKSCGCFASDMAKLKSTSHGLRKTRLYRIWANMKCRCYNKNISIYKHYGGRGIRICDEWKNSFVSFHSWAINNGYSDFLSIDRKDNNKNYTPSNCRWATRGEQSRNKRTSIKFRGECATDASKRLGSSSNLVICRLRSGWSLKNAFTKPIKNI